MARGLGMLDRTALNRSAGSPNRLGLFGMASEAAVDRIVATVPRSAADGCTALYLRLALHAARQNRSSTAHGQGCTVAVPELALRLGCSVRSVQRRLALLVSAGLLDVFGRQDARGRALASEYVFRYPRAYTAPPGGALATGCESSPCPDPRTLAPTVRRPQSSGSDPEPSARTSSLAGVPSNGAQQKRSGPPVVTPEARSTLNWVSSGPAALQGHQHTTNRTVTQDVVQQAPGAPYSAVRATGCGVVPSGPGDAVDAPPYLEEEQKAIDSAKAQARATIAAMRARAKARAAATGCATTAPAAEGSPVHLGVRSATQETERTPAVPPTPAPSAEATPPSRPTPPPAVAPPPAGRAAPGRLPVPLSALLPRGVSGLGERVAQVFAQRRQNGETSGSSRPTAPASG